MFLNHLKVYLTSKIYGCLALPSVFQGSNIQV